MTPSTKPKPMSNAEFIEFARTEYPMVHASPEVEAIREGEQSILYHEALNRLEAAEAEYAEMRKCAQVLADAICDVRSGAGNLSDGQIDRALDMFPEPPTE